MSILKNKLKFFTESLKRDKTLFKFATLTSVVNFLLFHFPFFSFVFQNLDYTALSGKLTIVSLVIVMLIANFFVFYLVFFLLRFIGKFFLALFFMLSAVSVYFVNTYGVIIDESMIGNVLNTRFQESSSFFSLKLVLYVIFFGLLPCVYIFKTKIIKPNLKQFFITTGLTLLSLVVLVFANGKNFLWVDKNSKSLGGLAMPWSYTVNTILFYAHKSAANEKEIALPDAKIMDDEKSVVVLVIGESARSKNFSLYGYEKNTNPLLGKAKSVYHFPAHSSATYTTAGVKAILEHAETSDLYEILPNYLARNGVDVVWRTNNWGEPPVRISKFLNKDSLTLNCKGDDCNYDAVLLNGLKEQILASKQNKVLIVLHTSTSHGPTYNLKYPASFETFKPVCNSVELSKCAPIEVINAYDNTIVYTDYILNSVIEQLKELKDFKSTMLFVSDHGESLGENNMYMHGLPMSLAPKEQYEIPFIVWVSDGTTQLKPNKLLTQGHVFHSVLSFLNIQSLVYDETKNIFE